MTVGKRQDSRADSEIPTARRGLHRQSSEGLAAAAWLHDEEMYWAQHPEGASVGRDCNNCKNPLICGPLSSLASGLRRTTRLDNKYNIN